MCFGNNKTIFWKDCRKDTANYNNFLKQQNPCKLFIYKGLFDLSVDLLGLEPRMPEPKTGVLPITP